MTDIERVIEVWDRYGDGYDSVFTEPNYGVARAALGDSGLEAGMTVLDIAAGSGALSIPAARMGADVLATDVSEVMLGLMRERASAEGLDGIRTQVMDGTVLDVGERRFDRVCSQFGVMFFADAGLPEMRRVTKPDGKAVVVIWGYPDEVPLTVYSTALERALPGVELPPEVPLIKDPGSLEPVMAAAGFRDIEIHRHQEPYPATAPEHLWQWMRGASPGFAAFVSSLEEPARDALHREVIQAAEERYGASFDSVSMGSIIGIGRP